MKKEEVFKQGIVIHCPTLEEAAEVTKILGIPSRFGLEYWNRYKELYCIYPNSISYSPISYYRTRSYTIITAKEFIEANTEPLIQVGTVIQYASNYKITSIKDGMCTMDAIYSGGVKDFKRSLELVLEHIKDGTCRIISQPKQSNMTQTISREGMKEIYDVACSTWQDKIKALTLKHACPFSNNVDLPQAVVDEMFKAANGTQIIVLKKYFKQVETFNSTMLNDGEVMKVDSIMNGSGAPVRTTHILRSYDRFIGFDSMGKYTTSWTTDLKTTGIKMASGSEFTLTVK